MKIKSNFKDFYDFIGNQYGGGDPKITYLRHKIDIGSIEGKVTALPDENCTPNFMYHYKWLIICGRYYLLLKPSASHPKYKHVKYIEEPWHYLDETKHADIYSFFVTKKKPKHSFQAGCSYQDYIGRYSEELVRISRIIDAPVFCITHTVRWSKDVFLDDNVPILSSYGIPSLISAQQMYQEIAYFISNKMCENADIKPPVIVSNKDLIVSKGFDLNQSFRHRK